MKPKNKGMRYIKNIISLVFLSCSLVACSKKTSPAASSTPIETKKVVVKKPKPPTPTVISVSDQAAQRTVDGRYYYDLNKKRYWRNNKDGKYYLFNKSMYNSPDFKGLPAN